MRIAIRTMGNSQGVLIPKPSLAQVGLEGTAGLHERDGVIEIGDIWLAQLDPTVPWHQASMKACGDSTRDRMPASRCSALSPVMSNRSGLAASRSQSS